MTTFYLIRHAEAEGNLYRRIHGQYNSLVTPLGYRQIAALEKRFQNIYLDAVYSSDLFRTQTTAKALYLPKGLPLQLEPGLREISMGDWEDDTWGGAARKHPEQMAYFSGGNAHYTPMGGESFQELRQRVVSTYYRLAAANDGKTIACVSHGEAIRTAVNAFYGRPLEEMHNMIPSDNTAVSCVEIEGETAKVLFYGDGSHLNCPPWANRPGGGNPRRRRPLRIKISGIAPGSRWKSGRCTRVIGGRLGSASTVTSLVPWSSSIRRRRRPVKRTPKRSWWP